MLQSPKHWLSHYHGSEEAKKFMRTYSYSDRIRYYWNEPCVKDAIARLLANLRTQEIPEVMLSRYLPIHYAAIRSGKVSSDPTLLVIHSIQQVIQHYSRACMSSRISERS
jgi:D-tagatose-1,6-bisphosphate aldolase subunit GatZ/KbaZ